MSRMSLITALQVLRQLRDERTIVLSTMGAAREWMALGSHPLDFIYAPSAMGQAPSLGLGMALAQPDRQVIVLNGDGCMLMNLGALVTITAAAPANLMLVVLENNVYEVTGGQSTPAAPAARPAASSVDFCQLARGAGFTAPREFSDATTWESQARSVLFATGPRFVVLKVAPIPGGAVPRSPAPPVPRALAFSNALRTTASGRH